MKDNVFTHSSLIFHLLIVLLAALVFPLNSLGQYERDWDTKTEHYKNGALKKVTHTKKIKAKNTDLYEHYKKTEVRITEFYTDSVTKMKSRTIYKTGSWGRLCFDVLYERTDYYPNGKKERYEKKKCDERRTVIKQYNKEGKLKTVTIIKNKLYEPPPDDDKTKKEQDQRK